MVMGSNKSKAVIVVHLTARSSVTRFVEILPLGKNFKIFGNFMRVLLLFGKLLNLLRKLCVLLGQFMS